MAIDKATGETGSKSTGNIIVSGIVGAAFMGLGALVGSATAPGVVLIGLGSMFFGSSVQGHNSGHVRTGLGGRARY